MFFNVASEFKKTKQINITLTVAQKLFLKVQNMFYLMCLKEEKSLTFLQNYTLPLFSLGKTNVCQLGFSQMIWQQAVKRTKGND